MNTQFYVTLASDLDLSQQLNNGSNFKINLCPSLYLEDASSWRVGLSEIFLSDSSLNDLTLVCSNIVEYSNVGTLSLPYLRVLPSKPKKNITFYPVQYKQLRFGHIISNIQIYLTDMFGSNVSFPNLKLTCTLHFIKSTPWLLT